MSYDLDDLPPQRTSDLGDLVLAGGHPFVLIKVVEPESGGIAVSHAGFDEDFDVVGALFEIAAAMEADRS